ncbi:MAG: YaaC family protein [Nitrospinota bacterium]
MDDSSSYIVEDLRKYFDQDKVWTDFVGLEYESAVQDILRQLLEQKRLRFRDEANRDTRFLYRYSLPYFCFSMQQAREHFASARGTTLLTKPLLLYYGMMSFMRALITLVSPDFFTDQEDLYHGIKMMDRDRSGYRLAERRVRVARNGLFPQVHAIVDGKKIRETELSLMEVFTRLPDLYYNCLYVYDLTDVEMNCARLIQAGVRKTDVDGTMWVQIEMESPLCDEPDRLPRLLREAFEVVEDASPVRVWASALRSREINDLAGILIRLRELSLEDERFLIRPVPSTKGEPVQFSELELHYLMMFYLSSIARYQPHLWGELLIGRKTPETLLVRNFIESSEKKFPCLVHHEVFRRILLS